MSQDKPQLKRQVVYADPQLLRLLRSAIALEGLTISEWFRQEAQKRIDRD